MHEDTPLPFPRSLPEFQRLFLVDRPALLEEIYRISLAVAANKLRASLPEARAILDACNGLRLTPEILGQHLRAEVMNAIELEGIDRKWGIDGRSLVKRLRELPVTLSIAVEVWTAEFWGSDRRHEETFEIEHLALLVRST